MRRPSHNTMVMGQPVIAAAIQLSCGGMLFLCFRVGWDAFWPGFVACCVMGETTRAYEAVQSYKRWLAAFDEVNQPRQRRGGWARTTIAVIAVGAAVGVLSQRDGWAILLFLTAALGAIALPIAFLRHLFRRLRSRPPKATPVTVIAKCHMAPIPLRRCHDLLPDHCRRILGSARP